MPQFVPYTNATLLCSLPYIIIKTTKSPRINKWLFKFAFPILFFFSPLFFTVSKNLRPQRVFAVSKMPTMVKKKKKCSKGMVLATF